MSGKETLRDDLKTLLYHRCVQDTPPSFNSPAQKTVRNVYQYLCPTQVTLAAWFNLVCDEREGSGLSKENEVALQGVELVPGYSWQAQVKVPGKNDQKFAVSELVTEINGQLAKLQTALLTPLGEDANVKRTLVRVELMPQKNGWLRCAYVKKCRKGALWGCTFVDGEVWKEASGGTWSRDSLLKFPDQHQGLADLDLTSLSSLVAPTLPPPVEFGNHTHPHLRYLVWSESSERYFKPEELVFLDVHSRALERLVQFHSLYANNPAYWAVFAKAAGPTCRPLEWEYHVNPARGWVVTFGDKGRHILHHFTRYKLQSNAATLYYLLTVKYKVHGLWEIASWLILYLFQMVVEWGLGMFQGLVQSISAVAGAAGGFVNSLLQWANQNFVQKVEAAWKKLPLAVQNLLQPLGYGAYFLAGTASAGPAFWVYGAVSVVLWQARNEIFAGLGKVKPLLVEFLGRHLSKPFEGKPPEQKLNALWNIVSEEFTPATDSTLAKLSSLGSYALQEALELAGGSEPVPVTNKPTAYLLLSYLFSPTEEQKNWDRDSSRKELEPWDYEILQDTAEWVQDYGPILHIFVDKENPAGHVYVRFTTVETATNFRNAKNGEALGARTVNVDFLEESEYAARFRASAQFVLTDAKHQAAYQKGGDTTVYSLDPSKADTITSERYPPVLFSALPVQAQVYFQELVLGSSRVDDITSQDLQSHVSLSKILSAPSAYVNENSPPP